MITLYLLSDIRKNYGLGLDPIVLIYSYSLRQETIREAELQAIGVGPSSFPFHNLTSKSSARTDLSIFPILLRKEEWSVEWTLTHNFQEICKKLSAIDHL